MKLNDSRGRPVSTHSRAALERYECAAAETKGYYGNALATLDQALVKDPDFAMAYALRALARTRHRAQLRRAAA